MAARGGAAGGETVGKGMPEPTDAELLKGITEPKSHIGKACDKRGVDRNHGLDQDRLVSG
jgi:hypothetical protein